ncbi:MAG: isoleucine--tRNA ligase [Nitrospirae bacterium]|nr:isoleucine--tRNA ligase [Nitrospirota bacterium]
MDYKDTLNLPHTAFPMKANLTQKEVEMLNFWKENNIYPKMVDRDKGKSYILHDGPPYANGNIHIGHALNKILKDIVVKYKAMCGFYAPYVPGWDCHGLPIEHQVDKESSKLKAQSSKPEDSELLLKKRQLCREYAAKFVNIQREEFKRLGVFGDWDKPYLTMTNSYEASIVMEFGRFVEGGYIYKGKKPVHWCPNCVTALAEAEVEYADKESPSIYVKFKVKNPANLKSQISNLKFEGVFFVIWTTTPWTLPANMALALYPKFIYRLVKTPEGELILAQDLIKDCMEKIGYKESEYIVTKGRWAGVELEGIVCQHPWLNREVETILGEHVTLEQGTGVVHTAPGHGEEDYEMGLKYGLNVYAPVDNKGRFTEDIKDLAGQNVFKANQAIIEILRDKKALIGEPQKITHSYPHCWRCKKPVIFRATEQWFISMEHKNLKNNALAEIEKVRWIPTWGKDRIHGMVERRPDWCISRQRAWGVPITLFQCKECKEFITDRDVIDKIVREVEINSSDVWFEKSPKELLPEGFKCPKCSGTEFLKETDILDVWFDSGVSHAAVMEIDQRLTWPADMYLEGSDQHRGWFQSSLLASTGTRDRSPYKAVLTHGFVVDGQGKKMSKSMGNVISPQEVTNKHGAEILRLWVSAADYREDMRISKEILDRLVEAYRKIRNTCRFLLGSTYDFDPAMIINKDALLDIDRFAMSSLQGLISKVSRAYEEFEFHEAFHSIYNFCVTDISAFYLDVLKDRLYTFKADSTERKSAQWVLYNILISLTKMMAPILSFTAEEIWQHIKRQAANPPIPPLTKGGEGGFLEESVFLTDFPQVEREYLDKGLEEKWRRLIKIRDEVNKSLEIRRQEKFIGNALEAKVVIYANEAIYKLLEEYKGFLPALFIVSSAETSTSVDIPVEAYKSPTVDGLAVLVQRAEGKKCGRCWNWSVTVGKYEEHPSICERCYNALKGANK